MKKHFFIIAASFLVLIPTAVFAQEQEISFFVDSAYDISGREKVNGALVHQSSKLNVFMDKQWWDNQNDLKKSDALNKIYALSDEFERNIYPTLTSVFGSEWKPGVDGDERITILLHAMREGAGGYFRNMDEYLKLQAPESNEREMIYLAVGALDSPQLKSFLSHEFTHLITFNQKDRLRSVAEETWLNEARAEYAPVLLGYTDPYEGSVLENRVKIFLSNPKDALTEWRDAREDYGVLSLFTNYLVDQYSVGILADSLQSSKVGIASLNEALQKNGNTEDFSQIFTDWSVAVFLNDCSYGKRYCYLNKNLTGIRLAPNINFLPLSSKSTLSITSVTKNWTGNWEKFIGGQGALKLSFEGMKGLRFETFYLVQDKAGRYTIAELKLNANQQGEAYIPRFGSDNKALVFIPSLQTKLGNFDGADPTYTFTTTVSIVERTPEEEQALVQELLKTIESLKKQIAELQKKLQNRPLPSPASCASFSRDLYAGVLAPEDVKCLQELLKKQGSPIYPEGLVTGFFGEKTRQAVIRFQELYAGEILQPAGLAQGNGYAGVLTRRKLNELLTKK